MFISLVVDLMHFGQFPVAFTCPADKTSSRPLLLAWVSYFGHQIPIIPCVEKIRIMLGQDFSFYIINTYDMRYQLVAHFKIVR